MPYFLGNGESGVHLAWSRDGRRFVSLADGKPVMTPPAWPKQNLTRDPSIVYRDGVFHMVWTSHWRGEIFGYAESRDLKHWSEPRQVRPFGAGLPAARRPLNVWAPELHYDRRRGDYYILFSSTLPQELNDGDHSEDAHGFDHRLYVIRTTDFESFSEPEVFFDPGHGVIDGMVAEGPAHERWFIYKNEMPPQRGGKNLRLSRLSEGDEAAIEPGRPIIGPGSALRPDEHAEGPTLLWTGQEWLLYWDAFSSGHYGLASSRNLVDWHDETSELRWPAAHPRHGTVLRVDHRGFDAAYDISLE